MSSDNVQAGAQVGSGPTFASYNTAGGVDHPAAVVEYATTLSAGANVLQPVTLANGLPVQPGTSTTWSISASALPLPSNAAQEAGGNLATLAGAVSSAKLQANTAQINGIAPSMGNGVTGTGVQRVTISSDSTGQINALQSGTWTVQPGNTANSTAWLVSTRPAASGGLTTHRLLSANTTNATNVKSSAGQVYGLYITNLATTAAFLKLYDSSSAPTAGSGTPKLTLPIPPAGSSGQVGGFSVQQPLGISFASGIGYTITGAVGDSDTTAVAANQVVVAMAYD